MTAADRFAIYYAPAPATPLWQLAALWLGRDAATGDRLHEGAAGLSRDYLDGVAASARRYGFHATLKPPMALADGTARAGLEAALADFAAARAAVRIGRLVPALLDGFLALVPEVEQSALTDFAADVVRHFEPFRRPLSPADRQRRLKAGLTPRQAAFLERYGYPWVMDEFRFHMTLSDRLPTGQGADLLAAARAWFAPALAEDHVLDRLVLFHEPAPQADFRRLADFPLEAAAHA